MLKPIMTPIVANLDLNLDKHPIEEARESRRVIGVITIHHSNASRRTSSH